jgi:hypothetical protein
MAISSSVNPYSSYTNASAFGVAIRGFDLALEHGHNVRRPLDRELFVQVHAFGSALDQADHPVVPRDVGGGGEVDGSGGETKLPNPSESRFAVVLDRAKLVMIAADQMGVVLLR